MVQYASIACLLFSCKTPEQPAGGPCSYQDTRIGARVITIDSVNADAFDPVFKLDSNIYVPAPEDTVFYHNQNNRYLTRREVDSLQVRVGNLYSFVVSEIVSGSCNPMVTWVELTPFVAAMPVADSAVQQRP